MVRKIVSIKFKVWFLLFLTQSFSQEIKHNQANWFSYVGQYNVSPKWGYHIEASFRLDNQLNQSNQNLFRLGGLYNLNQNITLKAGYGLINTQDKEYKVYYNEDRFWEQIQYNHLWNESRNTFVNRFRLEQRFVDELELVNGLITKGETNYQNRFRYLNRNTIHLANFKSGNEELYMVFQDEIFVVIGKNNVNPKFFDENRFSAGIGFNYKNTVRFEIAYMNQLINSKSGSDSMSHAISLTLFQNLILYKE